jgi:hypothetical protein
LTISKFIKKDAPQQGMFPQIFRHINIQAITTIKVTVISKAGSSGKQPVLHEKKNAFAG